MTWQRALIVVAAWFGVSYGAAIVWVVAVEWRIRRTSRLADRPIRGDRTVLSCERAAWADREQS